MEPDRCAVSRPSVASTNCSRSRSEERPEAIALVHEDVRLSYGELDAKANQLARHLIALGVGPDQPVAICLERGIAMVVSLLAVLKAGGAYLPLDPAYPAERLRQIVDDAKPKLLIVR